MSSKLRVTCHASPVVDARSRSGSKSRAYEDCDAAGAFAAEDETLGDDVPMEGGM